MKPMIRWMMLMLVPLALSACGPEVVGGGGHGTVHTTMSDDPQSGSAARSPAGAPDYSLASAGGVTDQVIQLDGSVNVEVAAELLTAAGGSIDLTDGQVLRTVAIGSSVRTTLGREDIEVGIYPRVRLTFTSVEASLAAGSPLPLEIEVGIGSEPLVMEVPLEVVVREEEVTQVNVDLNSAVWLALADPVTGLVARSAFASAVAVTAEGEQAS